MELAASRIELSSMAVDFCHSTQWHLQAEVWCMVDLAFASTDEKISFYAEWKYRPTAFESHLKQEAVEFSRLCSVRFDQPRLPKVSDDTTTWVIRHPK
ncbi:hypothetical protein STEG23_028330 [Scotinomys teguina]